MEETATEDEIAKAYKALAREFHPDKNRDDPDTAEKAFREIAMANDVVGDPKHRKSYDEVREFRKRFSVPRENPLVVIIGVIGLSFGVAHFYRITKYNEKRKRLLANNTITHKLRAKLRAANKPVRIKNNQLDTDVTDEELTEVVKELGIRVQGGWSGKKPEFTDVLKVAPGLPFKFFSWAVWSASWLWNYTLMNKEYSDSDKVYLTRIHLNFSEYDWEQLPEQEREDHLKKKLWNSAAASRDKKKVK